MQIAERAGDVFAVAADWVSKRTSITALSTVSGPTKSLAALTSAICSRSKFIGSAKVSPCLPLTFPKKLHGPKNTPSAVAKSTSG